MADRPLRPNGLPDVQRLITTHDSAGKAIFSKEISPDSSFYDHPEGFNIFLAYTTKGFPVDLNAEKADAVPKDIQSYHKDLNSTPDGLTVANGTALRYVDFEPGREIYMHRTESIDYGVVLEGVIEIVLDSGESRIMRRGDVCVQRGTMHAWRNITENKGWARMLYTLVDAEKIVIGGQALGQELSGKFGDE